MSYIFLDALKTEKLYKEAQGYLSDELIKIQDLNLKFNSIHKTHDIEFKEKQLIFYLDKLEKRGIWLRFIMVLILFITLIQLFSCVYIAFIQSYLNHHQAYFLVLSTLISALCAFFLYLEHRNFQRNKHKTLKLFLEVKNHNYSKIQEERHLALNPKRQYSKNSAMDLLFGEDE